MNVFTACLGRVNKLISGNINARITAITPKI